MSLQFVSIIGTGLAVGGVIGGGASLLMRRIEDPMIEITVTTIAAYGSFVSAETLQSSGVIAAVVAGILCGNIGARRGMSPSTRVASETFWEHVAFALNSIVFLLVGFEVHLSLLLRYWLPILVAYLVVTLGRALVTTVCPADDEIGSPVSRPLHDAGANWPSHLLDEHRVYRHAGLPNTRLGFAKQRLTSLTQPP